MTERALQGASLEATVGQLTTGRFRSAATARAVSRTLPPPAPTMACAPHSRAAVLALSISLGEHSPPKRWTTWRILVSLKLASHVSVRCLMAVLPAMNSTGPSRPRLAISRPRAAVAPLPWVYRVGEQNTESMPEFHSKGLQQQP